MVKRLLATGTWMPLLLLCGHAAAQDATGDASAQVAVGAGVATEPVPDRAAEAGEAPQGPGDRRTFWELIGEDNPNPATYEIGFVTIGMNQSWGLVNWKGGGIYFGAGGGVGVPFYRISKMEDRDIEIDGMLEAIFGNLFFRISPFHYADLDLGFRVALGASTFGVDDAPRSGFVRGGYADLRIGSRKVKLGPRFEYDSIAYAGLTETGWKITPLMLRVMSN
jgi:hypothetical protein